MDRSSMVGQRSDIPFCPEENEVKDEDGVSICSCDPTIFIIHGDKLLNIRCSTWMGKEL